MSPMSDEEVFGSPQSKPMSDEEVFGGGKPRAETTQPLNWSDVPGEALSNAPHSAVEFGRAMAQPFIHPVETYENVRDLGHGILQKMGVMEGHDYEKNANAVGQFFADRYGGLENIKRTLAKDPVGAAADAATVLTGGGGLAARAPGVVGKIGEVAGVAGRAIDPLSAVGVAARPLARPASELLGFSAGVGPEAVRLAGRAGLEGGEAARDFRQNIRGITPVEEVVSDAQKSIENLRQKRGAAYREGMDKMRQADAAMGEEQRVLDFGLVDKAIADVEGIKKFKGQDISPATADIRAKMVGAVEDWKTLPKAEFHTAEGLDALKQKLGNLRDDTQYGTPARVVADKIYQAVRKTIVEWDPQYAKVMRGYEEASNEIKHLERELSIPNPSRGNIDTSLRKLQSVLRNNVNTSYGRRRELAQFLVDNGSPNLLYKLAGQSLHTVAPRGLARLHAAIGAELGAMLGIGAHGAGVLAAGPAAAMAIPLGASMSPRLVGEASYWGARGYRGLRGGPGLGSYQLGRIGPSPEQFKKGGRVKRAFNWGG